MCRKFIYLTCFVVVLGISAGIANAVALLQDSGPDGIVSVEAENFDDNVAQGGNTWNLVTTPAGFSGTGAMQAMPNTGTGRNTGYVGNSPRLDYKINFVKTGRHYIWVRGYAPDEPAQPVGNNDSGHAGLDNTAIETCDRMSGFSTSYGWTNDTMDNGCTLEVPSVGPHTLNIWMREDGLIVDKIVLTTNPNYTPTGNGPPESVRAPIVKAYSPNPPDGAQDVATPLLRWTAGETAAFHDVYFGTNPTPGLVEFRGRQPFTMYWHAPGLTPDTTYYWRIDEVEADGVTIHTGYVWTFSTPVLKAHDPDPADGARWVGIAAVLSFGAGATAVTHDVYFGTNQADVAAGTGGTFKGNQPRTTYDPGTLQKDTTYYWRIDEVEADRTIKHKGDLWRFTTIGPNAGIRADYYRNMTLSGAPVLSRVDQGVNFNWAATAPDTAVGTDQFSVRWTGELEAPFSEPFTFTTGSDDGVRLYLDGQLIIDNWTDHSLAQNSSQPIQLVAGQTYLIVMEFYENTGDAVAQLYWQSPTIARQIIPAGPLQLPLRARSPKPANGATDIKQTPTLSWVAGETADKHDVYFGTDQAAVQSATTATAGIYRGRQAKDATSHVPTEAPLQWGQTYYWRVDEVTADGVTIHKGNVWSFTVADYLIVDDFEDYDDTVNRIFDVWGDYFVNNTGATVGHFDPPFAEQSIVHGGRQSMPYRYDNDGTVNEGTAYEKTGTKFYSEAEREWAAPQDWTTNGVKSLTLWFRGLPGSVGSFTAGPPIRMTAGGADIWGTADQFHYAYKQLSGVGSIQVKVLSVTNTDPWAKAGVMIRESLAPGATFAAVYITPGNGCRFQLRSTTDASATSDTSVSTAEQRAITAPYWVKLERTAGGRFNAYYSSNPATDPWHLMVWSPQTVTMQADVYIGLALTSHNVNATCVAEFSDVTTTGTVTGQWQSQDIGIVSNAPEGLYVALQDSTNKSAVVKHSDTAATTINTWTEWNIPLTDFTGLNLRAIKKLSIGVGDRANPQRGGSGSLYIDDIRLYQPRCMPDLLKPAGDFNGDCVVGWPDLQIMASEWLIESVAAADAGEVLREAESADTMTAPLQRWSDRADASGGQYVAVVPGNNSSSNPPDNGRVTYVFKVKGGVYKILARTIAPNGSDDSFWARIAGATTQTTNHSSGWVRWGVANSSNWSWTPVQSMDDNYQTVQFTLAAGTHTLEIAYREDGTLLDAFLITDNLGLDQRSLLPDGVSTDLNEDKKIDFKDYAILAGEWLAEQLWPAR